MCRMTPSVLPSRLTPGLALRRSELCAMVMSRAPAACVKASTATPDRRSIFIVLPSFARVDFLRLKSIPRGLGEPADRFQRHGVAGRAVRHDLRHVVCVGGDDEEGH